MEDNFLVLLTNRQSNILQDIDTLHLAAQVVTSICKGLDERSIVASAYELLSAFDELVTLGYRENLSLNQIKTFLEMESHEERIQEIIARNKELEASEERKRKAKQLEMQRKEMARSQRAGGGMGSGGMGGMPRTPSYPTYTPSVPTTVPDTYDSYNAEKNKSKPLATRGKGMQLGKKTKTGSAFDQIRGDLGPEAEMSAPLVSNTPAAAAPAASAAPASARASLSADREAIHITVAESISATLSREGTLESFEVKGDLQLRITDPALTQISLSVAAGDTRGAQLTAHPKVDKNLFRSNKTIQLADTTKGFPLNNSTQIMRWKLTPKPSDISDPPITFTVWVNDAGGNTFNVTIEYEFTGSDALKDVTVSVPYKDNNEPSVSSFDAMYEVSGDHLEWNVGSIDDSNPSGSFEFEALASSEGDFFPLQVAFSRGKTFVDVDVSLSSTVSRRLG